MATVEEVVRMLHLMLVYDIVGSGSSRRVRVVGHCDILDSAGVPIGYECDGATIPRCLWWLTGDPFSEPRILAAIAHDYRYEFRIGTRRNADAGYRDDLIRLGVRPAHAWTEWLFVRTFGSSHWRSSG